MKYLSITLVVTFSGLCFAGSGFTGTGGGHKNPSIVSVGQGSSGLKGDLGAGGNFRGGFGALGGATGTKTPACGAEGN